MIKTNNTLFNSNARLGYYATKNSRKYQGYQSVSLSGQINSRKMQDQDLEDDLENTTKDNLQRLNFSALTENRFYNSHKKFLEVDLDLATGVYNLKAKYTTDPETWPFITEASDQGYAITASLPILIGTGGIEDVQDARLAVYILDDLLAAGDLARAAAPDEILVFARFITEVKNKRYYDLRIKKIDEITRIDSMLNAMGLKAQSDASYFTILNDDWDFASGPVRRTGGRFSIGFAPNIDWSYLYSNRTYQDTLPGSGAMVEYDNAGKTRENNWGVDFITAYTWEKPVNLYWQHSVNTSLAYALFYEDLRMKNYDHDTLSFEYNRQVDSPNLRLIAGYRLGYYPNSRTELTLDINGTVGQYWETLRSEDTDDQEFNALEAGYDISFHCYYYISEQLRLTVNITNIYHHNQDSFTGNSEITGTSNEFQHHLWGGVSV